MSTFEEERKVLKASVARAFEGVTYPGDYRILAADCLDDMDVEDFYSGPWERGWLAVPATLIDRHYDSLSSFSPDAYRFFIPAYLCYALDAFGERTSLVLPWLLYDLDPESRPSELRHRFYAQRQFLTAHQRRVVAKFLEFVARHSDDDEFRMRAHRALEEYWGKAP